LQGVARRFTVPPILPPQRAKTAHRGPRWPRWMGHPVGEWRVIFGVAGGRLEVVGLRAEESGADE
jgi:hypothetical protein